MSAPIIATRTTHAGCQGVAQPAPVVLGTVSLWAVMRRMWVAITTRRELAHLDERMLRDLGLSKADVAREVSRAPWDTAPVRRGDRVI
jgi:uncharacterized protein YjiS (DUF1127 family)